MVTQKPQKAQKFEPKGSWLRNITQEKHFCDFSDFCVTKKTMNMKKEYIKPEMLVVALQQQGCLLADSGSKSGEHLVKDLGEGTDKIFDLNDDDFDDSYVDR